jgi:hypothetical protein
VEKEDKMVKETFGDIAKPKYDELLKEIQIKREEIAGLEREIKPLKQYLQTVGVLEVKRRGRKPKAEKQE